MVTPRAWCRGGGSGRVIARVVVACVVVSGVVLLLCVTPRAARGGATPLEDYGTRVKEAKEYVEGVRWLHTEAIEREAREDKVLEEIDGEIAGAETRMFAEVRRLLPPTEQVEWANRNLSVDNGWVQRAFDDYEQSEDTSHEARYLALTHISERLGALDARLAELKDASTAASSRDKEAEKGRMAAILRRLETNKATNQNESALNRLIKQMKEWVQSLLPSPSRIVPGASPWLSLAAQIFIYALAASTIAFVLWKFRASIFRRRRRRRSAGTDEARIVLGERLAPDQTAADLLAEAERLARGGDPRGAIRKAYVALLCELGDRKIIHLARHKTNRDYLGAVRGRSDLYSEMKPLTFNYEKHWYGFEVATDGDWMDFRARCRSAMSSKS